MCATRPIITFLLVVRNEARHLEQCIRGMLNQTLDPALYELIVVDSMSTDGSRDIVRQIVKQHPERSIRLVDNPGLILSCGWNIGIRAARGEYVIRPDAHGGVPADFLERNLAVMQAHPEAAAVGGILETVGVGFWGETIAALLSSRVGVGGSSFRVGAPAGPKEAVVFALYRRAELIAVGGLDEGVRLNQDNVLHARLRAANKILYFDPGIRSTYYARGTLGKLWTQMWRRAQWLVLMFKHQRSSNFTLRYYVPMGFVLILAALLVIGMFQPLAWGVLGILLGLYALAGWATATKCDLRPGQVLAFPLAAFVLHVSYGLGEVAGFLRLPFHRPDPSRMSPLKGES